MSEEIREKPWEDLEELLAGDDRAALTVFLEGLSPRDAARAVLHLPVEDQAHLLEVLLPEKAAEIVDHIPEGQLVADVIEAIPAPQAADILAQMPSDAQADVLADLEAAEAEAILASMSEEDARQARALSRYEDTVAGGLMVTECLRYEEGATATEVVADLRLHADRYRKYEVQYIYVLSSEGSLSGVLNLRDLLLAPPERRIRDLPLQKPLTVTDDTTLDELDAFFAGKRLLGVPVVDARGRLAGVVQRADVEHALAERTDSDYLKTQGIVGEEFRSMPVLTRSRRRGVWLTLNIGLNVLAASVIAVYQDTLSSMIALAVFLPIISDMSGCSGNQAVAVSMRELSLGIVDPREAMKVWGKEISVGLINGVLLGLLLCATALLWKGNAFLGLVVGTAMFLNTLVAVSIGGTVPLLLRRFGKDPALASGPILTTVTDICGFFLLLSLATLFLGQLTGG